MTDYQAGDRVRCTLGETVIVGTVKDAFDLPGVIIDGGRQAAIWYFPLQVPYIVEVLGEAEPPVGTVVLDGEGFAWQRRGDAWCTPGNDSLEYGSLAALDEAFGPLALLAPAWQA